MSARAAVRVAVPADEGLDPSGLAFPGGDHFWPQTRAADALPAALPDALPDAPRWMWAGGATVRAGAAALGDEVAVVRRVRDTIRSVLVDTAAGLGWRGAGARSAEARATALHDTLAAAADRLADARDALSGLAAELDGQHAVLGSVQAAWARSPGPAERAALLRRFRPAVEALDTADVRAAEALHRAAGQLVRLRGALTVDGRFVDDGGTDLDDGGTDRPFADGVGARVGAGIGRAWAGALGTATSIANAAWNHPEAVAEVVAGALLMDAGASGEALGLALDVTGVGALAGVPVGAVSAVPLVAGAGLLATGSATIMLNAAGDDRVTPANSGSGSGSGSGGGVTSVDIENANFAQKSASRTFSEEGAFSGRTIDDVVNELHSGKLTPKDIPIDVINRDGNSLILNTRSSVALQEAGVPRTEWNVVNRTGQSGYERRLTDQLARNRLDSAGASSVRIAGGR